MEERMLSTISTNEKGIEIPVLESERRGEISELIDEIQRLSNRLEIALAEGDNPVSMKCQSVLDSTPKCYDFSGSRRYAACRAWQVMDEEKTDWREAISRAWGELKSVCTWD